LIVECKGWNQLALKSGEHAAFDPAFEGTKPFEYKGGQQAVDKRMKEPSTSLLQGKVYTMAPNGVLFDPPNQAYGNQDAARV